MLERCKCHRIYLIVDALDECHDHNDMAEFFRHIVLNGLSRSAKTKWMLTSRPFDSAEQELFTGYDQLHISLELNSIHVSDAVNAYIIHKVEELSCRQRYGAMLKRQLEAELAAKAQGTFLWVSLVCKELEKLKNARPTEVLSTIQDLPPGLHPFYDRMFNQLSTGDPNDTFKCMRLLRVMMLAYRPLKVEEIPSLVGLTEEHNSIRFLVDRCASFINMQENSIQFVHQSARDYLAGKDLDNDFGHGEIARICLLHLSNSLTCNLLELQRPDSTRDSWKDVQHLGNTAPTKEKEDVDTFLRTKFLEWLECLSWLDKLPRAFEAFPILERVEKDCNLTPTLLQDARSFLLRHYHTINHWPLQIYSSAIIFSPESSVTKKRNLQKIPRWIRKISPMEDTWAFLVRTLEGHSDGVCTIAFSPDGNTIATGSNDKTIKIWDATTGECKETLHGHSGKVKNLAFTLDGEMIVSSAYDGTIKLWNTTTGDCQGGYDNAVMALAFSTIRYEIASASDSTIKIQNTTGDCQRTLYGHSKMIRALAFSPDESMIASGSYDETIKLWNAITGNCQRTLQGHFDVVSTLAFSPDGNMITSGSHDDTIRIWNTTTGDCQMTLYGHSGRVEALAFSPNRNMIASGSHDTTIKLWDTTTGDCQGTLFGHSGVVNASAFSSDGNMIASGSNDNTIKLWDVTTEDSQGTLRGYSSSVNTPAFSLDENIIASGSYKTVKLWNSMMVRGQKTLSDQLSPVTGIIAFSPDTRQIVCAKGSKKSSTIHVWDTVTGDLYKELTQHDFSVTAVGFSPDGKQVIFGSNVGSLMFRPSRQIKTSEKIQNLKFSIDSRYLTTNIGPINLGDHVSGLHVPIASDSFHDLYVKGQWICYGEVPLLRIPSDFRPSHYDAQGDQLVIWFEDDRVSSFCIDRKVLVSMVDDCSRLR
ncbi:hypothetical protein N7540_009706 [Penicillium herquei]|nr:hypothetical protein N7540_009706 [Penicillium herquei]